MRRVKCKYVFKHLSSLNQVSDPDGCGSRLIVSELAGNGKSLVASNLTKSITKIVTQIHTQNIDYSGTVNRLFELENKTRENRQSLAFHFDFAKFEVSLAMYLSNIAICHYFFTFFLWSSGSRQACMTHNCKRTGVPKCLRTATRLKISIESVIRERYPGTIGATLRDMEPTGLGQHAANKCKEAGRGKSPHA